MKVLIIFLLTLFSLNSYSKDKKCYYSDSIRMCYLRYIVKYKKYCYKYTKKTMLKEKRLSEDYQRIEFETKYKVVKKIGGEKWFDLCFHPRKYYVGVCREKICGSFNVPKD